MPLLDTRQKAENLVGRFIKPIWFLDIVLQVLSFVAQNERDAIKLRQAEGIRLAKLKRIHLGRPSLPLPDNFNEVATKYGNHEITNVQAREIFHMSKGTFFRNMKIFRVNLSINTYNDDL